jgi:hypothetical protein
VRYVLEGSAQRDHNRVRINAQLTDAASGAHLWADRFEEGIADLFKLQDQVIARLPNAAPVQRSDVALGLFPLALIDAEGVPARGAQHRSFPAQASEHPFPVLRELAA